MSERKTLREILSETFSEVVRVWFVGLAISYIWTLIFVIPVKQEGLATVAIMPHSLGLLPTLGIALLAVSIVIAVSAVVIAIVWLIHGLKLWFDQWLFKRPPAGQATTAP